LESDYTQLSNPKYVREILWIIQNEEALLHQNKITKTHKEKTKMEFVETPK